MSIEYPEIHSGVESETILDGVFGEEICDIYLCRKEVWKVHNEIGYEVSNLGRVKGKDVDFLKFFDDGHGYLKTRIKNKGRRLHRLVWETFCGPIPDDLWINHKNGIKSDSKLLNLEITTPAENTQHAFRTGLITRKENGEFHQAKLTLFEVIEIRKLLESGGGNTEIAQRFNISHGAISAIKSGYSWKFLGSANFPRKKRKRFTKAEILDVLCLLSEGVTQVKIAEKYGVEQDRISKIKFGKIKSID